MGIHVHQENTLGESSLPCIVETDVGDLILLTTNHKGGVWLTGDYTGLFVENMNLKNCRLYTADVRINNVRS